MAARLTAYARATRHQRRQRVTIQAAIQIIKTPQHRNMEAPRFTEENLEVLRFPSMSLCLLGEIFLVGGIIKL